MGFTHYSSDVTRSYISDASRSGRSVMGHTAAVNAGTIERKVHKNLDPKKLNRDKKNIRESRDSDTHPNSVPVAVIFDTTGSMQDYPERFVKSLPDLMDLITKRKYLTDMHVLFGAVNDATTNPIAALEIRSKSVV